MRVNLFCILATTLIVLAPHSSYSQSDDRRSELDRAERLALAAERFEASANQAFRDSRDREAKISEQSKGIDSMGQAVEIWIKLNESELIERGLNELARLYLVVGDVNMAVATTTRLVEYWHGQGNFAREGTALHAISIRLMQGNRPNEALRELEQTIEFALENNLPNLHASCLDQKASLLRKLGRTAESDRVTEEAREIRRLIADTQAAESQNGPQLPPRIPVGWVDLPDAPMFAEIRTVDGKQLAVLTNRSNKPIVSVTIGCAVERSDGWKKISELVGRGIADSQIEPGDFFDVTNELAGPRNRWTDRSMGCDDGSLAVVEVGFKDGTLWQLHSAASR